MLVGDYLRLVINAQIYLILHTNHNHTFLRFKGQGDEY